MKKLTQLMQYLKITYENIFVLHHNIVSANYYTDHIKMAEYHSLIEEIVDSAIEHSLAIDITEPTIKESIANFDVLSAEKRSAKESYELIYNYFTEICEYLDECKNEVPDYFKNLMEEWQAKLIIEAEFKIAHLLEALNDI